MFRLLPLVLFISTIGLTACGGGGSSKSSSETENNGGSSETDNGGSTETINALDEFTMFEFESDLSSSYVAISDFKNKDNIVYANYSNPDDFDDSAYYYLTNGGLYRNDPSKTSDGVKDLKIIAISDTQRVSSPYNLDGYNDLQETLTVKWIDVAGKKISDYTNVVYHYLSKNDPEFEKNLGEDFENKTYFNQLKKFIKATDSAQFPQGAKCFQITSITWNKPFASFQPWAGPDYKTIDAWIADQKDSTIKKGTWAGYSWASAVDNKPDQFEDIETRTGVQYNNAIYDDSHNQEHYTQSMINYYKNEVANGNGINDKAVLHALENGCDGYNKVAADTVKKFIAASK